MITGHLYRQTGVIVVLHIINDAIIDRFIIQGHRKYIYTPSGFILAIVGIPIRKNTECDKYLDVIHDTHEQFIAQSIVWMQLDRLPIAVNPVSYNMYLCMDSENLYIGGGICVYNFRKGIFTPAENIMACYTQLRKLSGLKPSELSLIDRDIIVHYKKRVHNRAIQCHRYADKYADVDVMCQE